MVGGPSVSALAAGLKEAPNNTRTKADTSPKCRQSIALKKVKCCRDCLAEQTAREAESSDPVVVISFTIALPIAPN